MDDTIVLRHHTVVRQSEVCRVLRQRVHLRLRYRILDGLVLIVRRRVMIGHAVDLLRTEALQPSGPHAFERLWRGHLVTVQTVDIELCRSVLHLLHHVPVPNLIK